MPRMSTLSMTGFGRGSAAVGARKISVDRRICLLEERVAALEAALRALQPR